MCRNERTTKGQFHCTVYSNIYVSFLFRSIRRLGHQLSTKLLQITNPNLPFITSFSEILSDINNSINKRKCFSQILISTKNKNYFWQSNNFIISTEFYVRKDTRRISGHYNLRYISVHFYKIFSAHDPITFQLSLRFFC